MKVGGWRSVGLLLPFFLTACFHRSHQALKPPLAPPLAQPSAPLATTAVELPPQSTTIPAQPVQVAQLPTQQTPRPRIRRHRAQPPVQKPAQEALSTPPPEVSAIGQLSSGDPAGYRRQTEESIEEIDHGLGGINRKLNDAEQKTADQIREFLKQARAALASGDVDGAHNLAAKAKVLLTELTQ